MFTLLIIAPLAEALEHVALIRCAVHVIGVFGHFLHAAYERSRIFQMLMKQYLNK